MTRRLRSMGDSFTDFTSGQKVVAVIGTLALLLAGFLVFRWAATPAYSPLFAKLSGEDASAIIDELEATGVPYQLDDGGATVLVPKDSVYETRIALSGEGLPAGDDGGYSLLDDAGLSTSEFQEQTSFKRAMEGELANTVEGIDGVDTAVVHLALPAEEVFASEQQPATASVLLDTRTGVTFGPEQVQAVVHLVASSIDGLEPDKVTVADSSGRVLSSGGDGTAASADSRAQQVKAFETQLRGKIQGTLDSVLGAGNSTVAVTAALDFDRSVTESKTYDVDPEEAALSESTAEETYTGAGGPPGVGGVVGPDGQMDELGARGDEDASYSNRSSTRDNAVDTVVERRESAPGSVDSLHIGVAIDENAPIKVDAAQIEELVSAAVGRDIDRGDTIEVSTLPFDRTAEEAAAAELEAAAAAEERAELMELARNVGLALLVVLVLLAAWWRSRKRERDRVDATTYVVEQLRADAAARTSLPEAIPETTPAMKALESSEADEPGRMRDELSALVEQQPEEVAALLRGWLVEKA